MDLPPRGTVSAITLLMSLPPTTQVTYVNIIKLLNEKRDDEALAMLEKKGKMDSKEKCWGVALENGCRRTIEACIDHFGVDPTMDVAFKASHYNYTYPPISYALKADDEGLILYLLDRGAKAQIPQTEKAWQNRWMIAFPRMMAQMDTGDKIAFMFARGERDQYPKVCLEPRAWTIGQFCRRMEGRKYVPHTIAVLGHDDDDELLMDVVQHTRVIYMARTPQILASWSEYYD